METDDFGTDMFLYVVVLILLDIDGVLNPRVARDESAFTGPKLLLSDARMKLVRRLDAVGRVAWVSSWPIDQTSGLETQLRLRAEPLRVLLPERAMGQSVAATPKLRAVTRWLDRMEGAGDMSWHSIVWIDDVLGQDAYSWAHEYGKPVLLVRPNATLGLTSEHVLVVEKFAGQ